MARSVISTVVVVAVVLLALALLAEWMKRSSLFFPDRYPIGQWNTERLPVKPRDTKFRTADGVGLHGWYFQSSSPDAPLLIWFHGNGGNLSDRGEIAAEFAMRGLSVFVFDYRGYGRSEGRPTETGLYADSLSAFDHAVATFQPDPRRIVLYGESLGGPYAARVAAKRGGRCVIIENSFPSLVSVARAHYRLTPFPFFVWRSLRTVDDLNAAGLPVLLLHGKRDVVIPYRLGVQLYEELNVPKEMITSSAGHSEIPFVEGARYYEAVTAFIGRAGR